jgi:glycosidase
MPQASYHGYANTETYHIDPRFGSNITYVQLGEQLHKRQMKLIFDVVPNHIGSYHWTVKTSRWPTGSMNGLPIRRHLTKTRQFLILMPRQMTKRKWSKAGLFPTMPDMNEQNPYVQNYLTQSHIWWIETAAIGGFRIDTYPYNDLDFMAQMDRSHSAGVSKIHFLVKHGYMVWGTRPIFWVENELVRVVIQADGCDGFSA